MPYSFFNEATFGHLRLSKLPWFFLALLVLLASPIFSAGGPRPRSKIRKIMAAARISARRLMLLFDKLRHQPYNIICGNRCQLLTVGGTDGCFSNSNLYRVAEVECVNSYRNFFRGNATMDFSFIEICTVINTVINMISLWIVLSNKRK